MSSQIICFYQKELLLEAPLRPAAAKRVVPNKKSDQRLRMTDSFARSHAGSFSKRLVKFAAAGSAALAALAVPTAAQASSGCPSRCTRSHTTDTLMISIAAGVAGVVCSPSVMAEILCAGGTAAAVTNYIESTKIECALIGCGPFYRP